MFEVDFDLSKNKVKAFRVIKKTKIDDNWQIHINHLSF